MAGEGPSVREAIQGALSSAASTASPSPSPSSGDTAGASSPPPSSPETAPKSSLNGPSIPTSGDDAGSPLKSANRGPDGKFQPKPSTDAAAQPLVDQVQAKSPELTPEKKDEGNLPPILAPSTWGKDEKIGWDTLPRATQAAIERREKDRDRALHQERQRFQTISRRYEALDNIIGPRRNALAAQGLDDARAVAQLFALSDSANSNPAGFIQWFAQQRGVDLASLVAGSQQSAPVDPTVKALQDQIARQNRVLSELGNHVRGSSQARENEAQGAMLQTIDKWSQEKDEGGNLKRPYFERLEDDVLALLPRAKAANPGATPTEWLQAAYDSAVYANSETRSALQKMEEAARLREQQAKAAKAAEQARITGTSITGSTAPNAGVVPAKSIREGLQRALDAQRGRAA